MKTESNVKPSALEVEPHGESAELIFRDNITEETREREGKQEIVYTYDEYRLLVPNRENLLKTVKAAQKDWLELAKANEYAMLAAEIRAKRDKLLAESDARMCLDRMGLKLPEGSTFGAWLSFLKGMGNVLSGKWASYRKALRDLPEQPGFPYDVEFPKPPEEK